MKHAAWLRSRWGSSNEHLLLLAHASVSTASKHKGIIPEIMIAEVILILEVILPERMITGRDHGHKRGENCVVGLGGFEPPCNDCAPS